LENKVSVSPSIRNNRDNESDKITQLLAQLQAPMTMDHLEGYQQQMTATETSSQREDYHMNQLELERAHH